MSTRIQIRGDTAANWVAANPVLAQRELAVETDTQLFKIGDGTTPWNSLPYRALRQIDEAEIINFAPQTGTPVPPVSGMNYYARTLAGRMLPRVQGPSGLTFPLQPSFFQNNIVMINANATTSVTSIGNTVTSAGTLSHPAPSALYPHMTDFATGATANNTAGTGNNGTLWARYTDITSPGGFFFNARLAFPNSNYNGTTGSTGSRIFAGLASGNITGTSSMVLSDDPAQTYCGFVRNHVGSGQQHATWQFRTRSTVASTVDTTLTFLPEKIYDFYIFCPPNGSFIGWRIDNLTDGVTREGETTTQLPTIGTLMRAGFGLATADAVNRNIRMQRVYTEADL